MPLESSKDCSVPGLGGGLQVLLLVLGRDGSWHVPSGLGNAFLHHAQGLSPYLHPRFGMTKGKEKCMGTWPLIGSEGQGIHLLAMVAQQGCGGEEGLALHQKEPFPWDSAPSFCRCGVERDINRG